MHLERKNWQTAKVTFDDIEERRTIGSSLPFTSPEYWRSLLSRMPGLEPYRHEDFPQTIEMKHKVLGRALGSIATSESYPRDEIADSLVDYFSELRSYSVEMQALRGRLLVDQYESGLERP